ncbi:MAG: hypothetical protein H7329_00600 [Opitutaceae bacterium]|nr:hypothetical protein [Cytophagales bacterium]
MVRNNIELKIQLEKANNAPKQIELLEKKLNDYETKLGFFVVEDNDNQEYLVRLANEFCQQNQLILREVPEHILEQENGLEIITTRITVQGEFRNLLKFLYYFEKSKISRIASVKYEKSEDYKTRKTYLAMHLLLQNIKIVSP